MSPLVPIFGLPGRAETTKDTDAIAMYKVMKDTLVYLTHLDTRVSAENGREVEQYVMCIFFLFSE